MIARRAVLGTIVHGAAGLPLAAVLADPNLARAADAALAWRRTLAFFKTHLS